MKLNEMLKSYIGKEFTAENLVEVMSSMDAIKAKAIADKDVELKTLTDKLAIYDKKDKEDKKNSLLIKQGINVDDFKELKAYDEFLLLEDGKEEEFLVSLKTKKPYLFKEKEKEVEEENEFEINFEDIVGDKEYKEKETSGDASEFSKSSILQSALAENK